MFFMPGGNINENDEFRTDEVWMEEALRAAQRALDAGEVPVGAVVIHQGKIIGRGFNRNILDFDPTAHAEVVALREAGASLGNHRAMCDVRGCNGARPHSPPDLWRG